MQKDEVSVIAQKLQHEGFRFDQTRDTVLVHIIYTELLQKKGAITAIIDAYSSKSELHLDIVSGVVQRSFEQPKRSVDIERVIRNDPPLFFNIYNLYGVSDYSDGIDDKSLRIVIMNGQIVSSAAYQYSFYFDETDLQRINQLINHTGPKE